MGERIDLSGGAQWAEFVISGHEFECEVFEAADLLFEIDLKHKGDLNLCLDCGAKFTRADASELRSDVGVTLLCPQCGASQADRKIRFSQEFLDDVAAVVRSRFGAPRCSRSEAWAFYQTICRLAEVQKKTPG